MGTDAISGVTPGSGAAPATETSTLGRQHTNDADMRQCPLMTQSGHERLGIAAVSRFGARTVRHGLVPAGQMGQLRGYFYVR